MRVVSCVVCRVRRWGLPDEKEEGATRDWREIVKGRYLLERNWLNGHYHMSTLRGHTGWYAPTTRHDTTRHTH